ncbi:MAG: hypothetical protein K1W39_14750 [Lachnospiraceae bacterium]
MGAQRKISIGDVFENLQVIENLGLKKYCGKNCTFYKCKCLKCGNTIDVPIKNLGTAQKDCGCGRSEPRKIIPSGAKYNHLTVIKIGHCEKGRGYWYWCECDCEKHTKLEVRRDMLVSGEVSSCGCVHDELFQKNVKKAYKKNFVQNTNVPKITHDNLQSNNTSGVRGVSWHKRIKKWQASIQFQGTKYHLGYYDDISKAKEIRKTAEIELHKDFWKWYSENFPNEYKKNRKRK